MSTAAQNRPENPTLISMSTGVLNTLIPTCPICITSIVIERN
jgi:hypothetical protein